MLCWGAMRCLQSWARQQGWRTTARLETNRKQSRPIIACCSPGWVFLLPSPLASLPSPSRPFPLLVSGEEIGRRRGGRTCHALDDRSSKLRQHSRLWPDRTIDRHNKAQWKAQRQNNRLVLPQCTQTTCLRSPTSRRAETRHCLTCNKPMKPRAPQHRGAAITPAAIAPLDSRWNMTDSKPKRQK